MALKVSFSIDTSSRWMAAVCPMAALIDVHAVTVTRSKSRFAFAVIPPRHIHAHGCVAAAMHTGGALVQILLARGTNEANAARAHTRCDALATV